MKPAEKEAASAKDVGTGIYNLHGKDLNVIVYRIYYAFGR